VTENLLEADAESKPSSPSLRDLLNEIYALEDRVEPERCLTFDFNLFQIEETYNHSSPVDVYKSYLP
jgi:hypothetical protein